MRPHAEDATRTTLETTPTETQRVLGDFRKNSRERVVVVLHKYRGHELLGIRVQWRADESGEWKWSTKGLTVGIDKLPDLLALLTKAMETVSPTWRPAA